MAVPKRRLSSRRRGNRRSTQIIGKAQLRPCSHCGAYGIPHRVCSVCGHYKNKLVVAPKVKKPKAENQ